MVSLVEFLGRETFDQIFFSFITMLIMVSAYLDLRDKNFPPGPIGTPLFGYLPMLNPKTPYNTLKDLASHYGKAFSMTLGSFYTVVIADAKLIHEALNLDTFHEKTPLLLANGATNGKGILMADSQRWKQHRFFLMSALKTLGVTKKPASPRVILEDKIQTTLSEFVKEIKQTAGNSNDIKPALQHSIGSLLMDVVTGIRPEKGDQHWGKMQSVFTNQMQMMSITSSTNFVPLLRNFSKYTKAIGELLSGKAEANKLHKKCLDKYPNPDPRNFQSLMEAYIAEAKRRQGSDESFSAEQISQVLMDTMTMGWETTMNTIHWLFIYLSMHPEVQDYIVKEMDQILGSKRENLSLDDCKKLTYTQAVIMEVMRHRPVLPMGIPHCAAEKTKLGSYWIQPGTIVIPLIYAVHRDQRYWDKPDDFIPERHLNDDGSIRKSEYLIPFQTGKKSCIGEELAQWTILLFLVGVINEFKISFANGVKFSQDDLPDFSVTSTPPSYRLTFETR